MLVLPTFLIFVSLSVAAIPLGLRTNGQTPHIRGIPATLPPPLPDLAKALPVSPEQLLHSLPLPLPNSKVLRRFIMGADYASSSGPFLGKSSHKRQDPLSGVLRSTPLGANDMKEENNLSPAPGSTPT
jgi:hypothetical protein